MKQEQENQTHIEEQVQNHEMPHHGHQHNHADDDDDQHGHHLVQKADMVRVLSLPVAIILAAVIISVTILYTKNNPGSRTSNPDQKVNIKLAKDDHVLGDAKARVTIFEFSDFQCPFCRSFFNGAFAQIKSQYVDTGKVKLVYRHMPLSIHPVAQVSAEASECAAEQGKFWEFHDKIFQEQDKISKGTTVQYSRNEIIKWVSQLGLDMKQFNQCLDSGKYTNRVNTDLEYANKIGVDGTPTFFVNGQIVKGALPFASFQTVIEE